MTSQVVSPMSWRSPLVKVIGLMASFEALTFFLGLDLFVMHGHLICVDTVPGSILSFSIYVPSASYPEDVAWPSSTCTVVASTLCTVVATSATFFCSMASCATSWTALSSVTTFSFHLFSTSWVMRSLASSFFFCVVAFSNFAKSGVCHSGGHISNIVKISS